jgi:hypothetical protein
MRPLSDNGTMVVSTLKRIPTRRECTSARAVVMTTGQASMPHFMEERRRTSSDPRDGGRDVVDKDVTRVHVDFYPVKSNKNFIDVINLGLQLFKAVHSMRVEREIFVLTHI